MRDLDALKIAFCDEDTATWSAAAMEIGQLAADDPDALAFMSQWLERNPASRSRPDDVFENEVDVHRFRHACCALASYLSEKSADRKPVQKVATREIRDPLAALAFNGVVAAGTVADLRSIPGAFESLHHWRDEQIGFARSKIERFREDGNDKALAKNQRRLGELQAIDDASKVPSGFHPDITRIEPHTPWVIASYFAGVRGRSALFDLPLDYLLAGLLEIATERKLGGLPFALNLPTALLAIRDDVPEQQWRQAVDRLIAAVSPTWAADRLHYNDFILSLAPLAEGTAFGDLWTRGIDVPAWLNDAIAEFSPRAAPKMAARILRRIARDYFSDDWRWRELDDGERFVLNTFSLLIKHGTTPFVRGGGRRQLTLDHRIAILLEAIDQSSQARDQVLPALVRCLKVTLGQQLTEHLGRADMADICRQQIAIVRPLVAEWRLPGTLRKDLATIVSRVLIATYHQDRAIFVELLYNVLFALPDEVLFRQVIAYSTEPEVSSLIATIVAMNEHWHGTKATRSDDDGWRLYNAYAEDLVRVTGDDVPWVHDMTRLTAKIGRARDENVAATKREEARLDDALRAVLECKQAGLVNWDTRTIRQSDRKGAQWAALERARTIQHNARAIHDRFSRLLDDAQILETDCLPELGRPRPSDDLVRRWRRLIGVYDELRRLCRAELPYPEREMCSDLLGRRIDELESRLDDLVRVLEKEEEHVAIAMIERNDDHPDQSLVQEWMLGRYMVRELAETMKLRALGLLTSAWFVIPWILAPFAICIALDQAKLYAWRGVPFAASTILNLAFIVWYFLESRKSESGPGASGRFLLPQTTAALFLGLMEVLSTDEAWSLAVLEYPWVRLFTIGTFLLTGFFFTREVLLGNQLQERSEIKRKNRRAASVMALALWQSFLLVALFGVLGGRVMGARAELDPAALATFAESFGGFLPTEVHLGQWFLQPAETNEVFPKTSAYRIFPWAILTWTVQVFFFSAIFERIMQRSTD